jgi:hypothetical protein
MGFVATLHGVPTSWQYGTRVEVLDQIPRRSGNHEK